MSCKKLEMSGKAQKNFARVPMEPNCIINLMSSKEKGKGKQLNRATDKSHILISLFSSAEVTNINSRFVSVVKICIITFYKFLVSNGPRW